MVTAPATGDRLPLPPMTKNKKPGSSPGFFIGVGH
jgi:hypothetical protein